MYVVNTSFMVDPACHGQWYALVTGRFIEMLRSEGFEKFLFTRVLSEEPCPHHTYSLQVDVEDIEQYQRFMNDIIGEYRSIASPLLGDGALYFTTLLKKIEL